MKFETYIRDEILKTQKEADEVHRQILDAKDLAEVEVLVRRFQYLTGRISGLQDAHIAYKFRSSKTQKQ